MGTDNNAATLALLFENDNRGGEEWGGGEPVQSIVVL
jgi:hypothetical protein